MISIVLPVSRDNFLNRIFMRLELLECEVKDVNLLVMVDGDYQLFEKTRNKVVHSKFNQKLCVHRKKSNPHVGSVKRRRQRISKIHNEIKEFLLNDEFVFLIEDDTLFKPSFLKELYKNYISYPYAGLISAVELGRWGYTMIGGWKVDNVYEPNQITSVKLNDGLKEVDATGLYCCLTKREFYVKHEFKPFEEILGPDVDFGIELRKQGYKNYINHDLKCKHLTKRGEITFRNSEVVQVKFDRNPNIRFGWKMAQI